MPGTGPSVSIVKRLRVYTEPNGSFATDHSGTLGDFQDVPLAESGGQVQLTEETHNPATALQNVLDFQEKVVGKKTWSLTFTTPLAPTGTAAAQGTTAVQGAIGEMLKALMGGEFLGRGTTIATWATSAGGSVATASNLRAGGAVSWQDSNGQRHVREIETISGSNVTLKVGFPGVPSNADPLHAAATYYFTQDPDTSLQFLFEGQESTQRYVLMGGQGTVTPNLPLDGTIPTLQWNINGVDWTTLDSADIADATHTNYEPITGHVGRLLVGTVDTATYSGATVDAAGISFQPGMAFKAIPSPSGVNGVLRWHITRSSDQPPISGSFATYYEDNSYRTHLTNKTNLYVAYQNGVTAGEMTMLSAGTVQVLNVSDPDQAGIAGHSVEFAGRLDAGTTETTATDLGRSPFRIHLV